MKLRGTIKWHVVTYAETYTHEGGHKDVEKLSTRPLLLLAISIEEDYQMPKGYEICEICFDILNDDYEWITNLNGEN